MVVDHTPPPASLYERIRNARIRWRAPLLTAGALIAFLLPALGLNPAGATWLGQGGTVPPAPCFSQTSNGILFGFLGYETVPDDTGGTTTLSVRITNPHNQPVPQVQIAANGWTPVSPEDGSVYAGESGTYGVQWFPRSKKAPQSIFRFVAHGADLRDGTSETFHLTVRDFDPQTPITAWTKAGPHRATFAVVPAEHDCDLRPTPAPTATPLSPLPTPTTIPLTETISTANVLVLDKLFFNEPLSEEEKQQRWQQGLPVPLLQIDDESTLPIVWEEWIGEPLSSTSGLGVDARIAGVSAQSAASLAEPVITDGWSLVAEETFEEPGLHLEGCQWRSGYSTNGATYSWGRGDARAKNGSYSWWPAGTPQEGAPSIPPNGSYPSSLETWWQCELSRLTSMENVLAEFELWYELDTPGDQLNLRFYETGCEQASATSFRGGLTWQGTQEGVPNAYDLWKNYRVFYPSLQSTDGERICIEFKFTSDTVTNNSFATRGPWLDDVQFSTYQKPATSIGCQDRDPTIYLPGAPGSGQVSKALVVPPYADDIGAGVVDVPDTTLDIAGMVQRLLDANVHWVRLEFVIPPEELNRIGFGLDPKGVSRVDLRHFDRIVDMLCANNIAVLGLIDYQTLERQDWETNTGEYVDDFIGATENLVSYYGDRIRYWEVWNEPNFSLTQISDNVYATLLIAAYDAIKATDTDDQVLFGGLAQTASDSLEYFGNVSLQLSAQGRQNPAPYDIFALHPYPSDEYMKDGRVVVDPQLYLRWPESVPPQPTTIHKFLALMVGHGKENQPLWITEIGWNRADESTNSVTQNCPAVTTTMVDGYQQALYQLSSFDLLFRDTAWDSGAPSVNKIFWYQYVDVGIPESQCVQVAGANTPSGPASFLAQGAVLNQPESQADWWFGLYQGINWDKGGVIEPNSVQCTFSKYPIDRPTPILECFDLLYLPVIQSDGVTASGQ